MRKATVSRDVAARAFLDSLPVSGLTTLRENGGSPCSGVEYALVDGNGNFPRIETAYRPMRIEGEVRGYGNFEFGGESESRLYDLLVNEISAGARMNNNANAFHAHSLEFMENPAMRATGGDERNFVCWVNYFKLAT